MPVNSDRLLPKLCLRGLVVVALQIALASASNAAVRSGLTYAEAGNSNDNYAVQITRSGKRTVGCGASDRHIKPFLFLNIISNGYGSLSFVASNFHVTPRGRTEDVVVSIASHTSTIRAVVDGNVVTFDLTKAQIASAQQHGLVLNDISIDRQRFAGLQGVVAACLKPSSAREKSSTPTVTSSDRPASARPLAAGATNAPAVTPAEQALPKDPMVVQCLETILGGDLNYANHNPNFTPQNRRESLQWLKERAGAQIQEENKHGAAVLSLDDEIKRNRAGPAAHRAAEIADEQLHFGESADLPSDEAPQKPAVKSR